jgi:hypothetical protein
MFRRLIAVLVVALCVGAGVTTAQTTPNQATASDTFIWHAELVSVDAGTGTLTVKAMMLSDAAKEVAKFNAGDRVLLTWSGIDQYAGAVRQIARHAANQKIDATFAFPVELASRDVTNDYVTFRFRAPSAAVSAVKAVKPGEWVTVTVRQRSSGEAQGIVSVAPYVKSSSNT